MGISIMNHKRVAIICYTYSDGFAYMEQKLAQAFFDLSCEVLMICSTANRIDSKTVIHAHSGEYRVDGYTVCRLPFISGRNLTKRKMPVLLKGMYKRLSKYHPDIIYHMSCSALNLLSVRKYMKRNPDTLLYVDNHATLYNSANNALSRVILHRMIYRAVLLSVDKWIKRYFYVGKGEKVFLEDFYKVKKEKCSFFSLGDFVFDEKEYCANRNKIRNRYHIDENNIVISYSGKFTKKKRTIEIISMISQLLREYDNLAFLLIGQVQDNSIENRFNELLEHAPNRFYFLGWKNSESLKECLCASDIYIQFDPSSTFQTALCCHNYGITGNVGGAYDTYPEEVFSKVNDMNELSLAIVNAFKDGDLQKRKDRSYMYAKEALDYRKQICRIMDEN